jgi:protein-S-isoprenylcysteine O-methyltransferase Ste14
MTTPPPRIDPADHPGVVIFPPLLFLLCLGVPWAVRAGLGGLAVVLAAVFGLGGERALHGAGTNVRPDRPTTAVVTSGIYRFTRNPLYLALLSVYTAVAVFVDSLWPFALWVVLLPVLVKGIVEREERYLERKFGEPYRIYKTRVRRWL